MNRRISAPWPWLLAPTLAALTSAYVQAVWHEDDPASASLVALYFLLLLPLTLGVPLLARWLLGTRGEPGAFAGFCLGWAASLLVWNGWAFFLPRTIENPFWVIVSLCLLLPVLGGVVGSALSSKS